MKHYNIYFGSNNSHSRKRGDDFILLSDFESLDTVKYSLSGYFEESHRISSKFLQEDYKNRFGTGYNPILMSLYKVYYSYHILPICQLLLVARDRILLENCSVNIFTEDVGLAKKISEFLKLNKTDISIKHDFKFKKYFAIFNSIFLIIKYLFNGLFVEKDKEIEKVLVCFSTDRFIAPYYSKNSITYPMFSSVNRFLDSAYENKVVSRKFISISTFVSFIPEFIKIFLMGYRIFRNTSTSLNHSAVILIEVLMSLSLKQKYKNMKELIGTFDASPVIDAITFFSNKKGVETIITPHGMPFTFKSPYLSYGVNLYCAWSEFHSELLKRNKFTKESCKVLITGNPIYQKMFHFHQLNKKNFIDSKKKKVLMIMENISDDFCRSIPYQSFFYRNIISKVVEVCNFYKDVSLNVRTRNQDKVFSIAKEFSQSVFISTSKDTLIEDDIIQADIVITQYSNAINEALIFGKNIIQIDLYKVKDWHTEIVNPYIKRVSNIEDLNNMLHNSLRNAKKTGQYCANKDKRNFNNCQYTTHRNIS